MADNSGIRAQGPVRLYYLDNLRVLMVFLSFPNIRRSSMNWQMKQSLIMKIKE